MSDMLNSTSAHPRNKKKQSCCGNNGDSPPFPALGIPTILRFKRLGFRTKPWIFTVTEGGFQGMPALKSLCIFGKVASFVSWGYEGTYSLTCTVQISAFFSQGDIGFEMFLHVFWVWYSFCGSNDGTQKKVNFYWLRQLLALKPLSHVNCSRKSFKVFEHWKFHSLNGWVRVQLELPVAKT